jgi:hypothetical protein
MFVRSNRIDFLVSREKAFVFQLEVHCEHFKVHLHDSFFFRFGSPADLVVHDMGFSHGVKIDGVRILSRLL